MIILNWILNMDDQISQFFTTLYNYVQNVFTHICRKIVTYPCTSLYTKCLNGTFLTTSTQIILTYIKVNILCKENHFISILLACIMKNTKGIINHRSMTHIYTCLSMCANWITNKTKDGTWRWVVLLILITNVVKQWNNYISLPLKYATWTCVVCVYLASRRVL
jgi:hypothetical protein